MGWRLGSTAVVGGWCLALGWKVHRMSLSDPVEGEKVVHTSIKTGMEDSPVH